MTQQLVRELELLRLRVLRYGRTVNKRLEDALEALLNCNMPKAEGVLEGDAEIDNEDVALEEECMKIIALHQPVARDLRFLVTVLKVTNDLERIADHAVNLAFIARKFAERGTRSFPPQIVEMGRRVTETFHLCLDAFLEQEVLPAIHVCRDDKTINELCGLVYDEAKRIATEAGGTFGHATRVYRVGRELERVGDLLKNIAEDTIYMITGEVVRHKYVQLLELEEEQLQGEH